LRFNAELGEVGGEDGGGEFDFHERWSLLR
jgi:hypothetical protein